MQTFEHSSWSDFAKSTEATLNRQAQEVVYPTYYRGQSDANWKLKTTLERYTGLNLGVISYYKMIEEILPNIETFTGKKWNLPIEEDFVANLARVVWPSKAPDSFHYMAYLRHYGFPSPLLDWTYSPFVAAYFAFRDIAGKADSVAIYSYMESWESHGPYTTQIYPVYAHSRNNKRHYLQQSVYSICLKETNGFLHFSDHEDPSLIDDNGGAYISRVTIPASERAIALHSLDAHNINAYSLFGTEESLLETMFVRKYIKVQREITYHSHVYKGNEANAW